MVHFYVKKYWEHILNKICFNFIVRNHQLEQISMTQVIDSVYSKEDSKIIEQHYNRLLQSIAGKLTSEKTALVEKAFQVAATAHKLDRRKSGEPYITHPIEVALIVSEEMGLGATSIASALLHDTVEDTELTLADIKHEFGEKIANIIDGLTKISEVVDLTSGSLQAENFRKILLTISEDIRVIIVKLADRLHNMRTLESMRREKQLKIASETLFLYAPLAHRFGFYNIKSEFEDLCLRYMEPEVYKEISTKLAESKSARQSYIDDFIQPIKKSLDKAGLTYTIKGRPKHIYSIWSKMKNKNVSFEEMYDLFAIRIILNSKPELEKADCWRAYSIVTDFYKPNPDRLKDFISNPKANGYESLHATVMGPKGRWVEVQIRTERMDAIAEQGLAAHWKYKEGGSLQSENTLDLWIKEVRELLQNPESNAIEFVNNFKSELFDEEIYIFTPKGDVRMLPKGSTALDFAFAIHSQVGSQCMGAKVNHKLVPISHVLSNGDQVEIITSKKQKPSEDWLKIVQTSRARSKIKSSIKEEKKEIADIGKDILDRKLKALKIKASHENIHVIANYFKQKTTLDLHFAIAQKSIDLKELKDFEIRGETIYPPAASVDIQNNSDKPVHIDEDIRTSQTGNADILIMGNMGNEIEYEFANCCKPIPGDDVFGFVTIGKGIKIHRTNCPNAVQMMSKYGYRVVKVDWNHKHEIAFLSGIHMRGFDGKGLVNKITGVISGDMNLNMQSLNISSDDGVFEGELMIYVDDTKQLDQLIAKIKSMEGMIDVRRI